MAAFIAQTRTDLGRPDLPFIFSHIAYDVPASPKYPNWAGVTKGKAEVARTVPHTATVSTAGLSRIPGDGHYDTAGTMEFGRRFFEVWQKQFHKPTAETDAAQP